MPYKLTCHSCGITAEVPIDGECPTCPNCGRYIKGDEKVLTVLKRREWLVRMAFTAAAFNAVPYKIYQHTEFCLN